MRSQTSDYGLAVADAGMRQIHADRREFAARVEQLRRESQQYGTDAFTGFYKVQANGGVNILNDATKIVGIPEIPKFEVTGEYWQDRKGVGEAATTVGAALVTGGASLPSDLPLIGSSAGNMAEAATGTDMRTGGELSTAERIMRGAGGAAGAVAVRGTVDDITQAVSSGIKNVKPPASAAEAVTAEGISVRVPTDDALTATHAEARAVKETSGRRNIEAHEAKPGAPELKGHTIEQHVGKSENWLRKRLETDPTLKDTPFASSFYNEAAANRSIGRFIKQNRAEIEAWAKNGKTSDWKYEGHISMKDPVGLAVGREKAEAYEASKAYVCIIRDSSPQGWHVMTAYPVIK